MLQYGKQNVIVKINEGEWLKGGSFGNSTYLIEYKVSVVLNYSCDYKGVKIQHPGSIKNLNNNILVALKIYTQLRVIVKKEYLVIIMGKFSPILNKII